VHFVVHGLPKSVVGGKNIGEGIHGRYFAGSCPKGC